MDLLNLLRLRPLEETMPLSGGNEFALKSGPFTGGLLLLWSHGSLERLFEDEFGKGDI